MWTKNQKKKTKLPPPTSVQEERKNAKKQPRKEKTPNTQIVTSKEKEDDKLTQPSIKDFLLFTKKKIEEKEKDDMEDNEFPPQRSRR